jgi:hypothetical protein
VLAASLNDFVAMLPDFNRALTRKIVQLQERTGAAPRGE